MTDDTSERLRRLESHVAHLERHVEELNDVIVEQGKLVERLKKELQRQSGALRSLELDRIKSHNPPPPHYQ